MKTILLIEDDPALLRLEQKVLGDAGYSVDPVTDEKEARTKLGASPYAGIVLNITVAGSEGYAFALKIGGLAANRFTPLVILGSDEPDARKRAFDAGALAFLPKPVTAEAFRSVIQSVLSPVGARAAGGSPAASGSAGALAPPPSVVTRRASLLTPSVVPPDPAAAWPAAPSAAPPRALPAPPDTTIKSGSIAVSSESGVVYWCEPEPDGGWRCGRCELGVITWPEAGSRCTVCQAEVLPFGGHSRSALVGLIVAILLVMLGGWAMLAWLQ